MQSPLEQQGACICVCSPLPVLTVYGWLHVCLWGPAAAMCCGCWWAPVSAAQTWSILQEWDITHSLHQFHHNLIRFEQPTQTQSGPSQLSATIVDAVPQCMVTTGTYWDCKIFPQLSPPEGWQEQCFSLIHTYNKPRTIWTQHKSCFHATPTLQTVSLNTTGPSPAAGFLLCSCPLCSDLRVELKDNFSFRGSIPQESLEV